MRRRLRRIGALVRLSLLELWRRNDMFALLVLALVLLVPLSMARPFGVAGATRYYDDAALLLVWGYSVFVSLGVVAITVAVFLFFNSKKHPELKIDRPSKEAV